MIIIITIYTHNMSMCVYAFGTCCLRHCRRRRRMSMVFRLFVRRFLLIFLLLLLFGVFAFLLFTYNNPKYHTNYVLLWNKGHDNISFVRLNHFILHIIWYYLLTQTVTIIMVENSNRKSERVGKKSANVRTMFFVEYYKNGW